MMTIEKQDKHESLCAGEKKGNDLYDTSAQEWVESILNSLQNKNGDFSSLLKKESESLKKNGYQYTYSYMGEPVGIIRYTMFHDAKNVFLDDIITLNNIQIGAEHHRDYWGIITEYKGIKIDQKIPGVGTHMLLDFLKECKEQGKTMVQFYIADGADGFYNRVIEEYEGKYFTFRMKDGECIFDLL